jgi:hypothetical protein
MSKTQKLDPDAPVVLEVDSLVKLLRPMQANGEMYLPDHDGVRIPAGTMLPPDAEVLSECTLEKITEPEDY